MRIHKEDTLAIVVDYQEKLVPAIHDNENIIKNSAILIKGLRALNVPIIVSQQYTKGLGETVPQIKEALGEFTPYEKTDFSVYAGDIKEVIEKYGKKNYILCGTEAHICVLQTLIDLREVGYNVFYVEDCVGSRTNENKQNALKRVAAEGGFITSSEAVLFELTQGASSNEFKTISNLVK